MFIAKIIVPTTWTKVEDLIKALGGDLANFDMSTGKFILQAEADSPVVPVRLCDLDSVPTQPNAGERIVGTQVAVYEKDDGDLYCKASSTTHPSYLSISQIGA